jgi:predicted ferric reductase
MMTAFNRDGAGAPSQRRALVTPLEKALGPITGMVIGAGVFLLLASLGTQLLGVTNVYWYLSRSSAMVGFVLLWASMALGISITNKLARFWPGAPTAFDLHQYVSLLGLGFAVVHVLSLLGDTYIGYDLGALLLPFGSVAYAQFWVGLGQVAFYLLIPVTLSFYARKRLGRGGWRTIHGLSYALFGLTLLHGLFSGSDSAALWTQVLYWFTGVSLLALTAYRLLLTSMQAQGRAAKRGGAPHPAA